MKKIITLKENALRDIVKESLFSILNKERNKQLDIESIFHFSQIPTEELKQQYVDYSFYDKINGYKYINTINESVDIYLQAQNAKDEMTRLFGLKDWQVVVYKGYHKVEVILLYAGILKNTKINKNEMKRLGFFPSISSFQFRGFMLWRAIKFEPYNQYDLTKKARRFGENFTSHDKIRGIFSILEQGLTYLLPAHVFLFSRQRETKNLVSQLSVTKFLLFLNKNYLVCHNYSQHAYHPQKIIKIIPILQLRNMGIFCICDLFGVK